MRWRRTDADLGAMTSAAEWEPECWRFKASTAGSLRIQPAGPTLSHEELAWLLDRLQRRHADAGVEEIVFDLSRVEAIGPQWTLVLALLIGFARSVKARCRVVSLHGQPANVVQLYRRNHDVALLLSGQTTRPAATHVAAVGA